MKIAIFGSTSKIAKDLIISFSNDQKNTYSFVLFSRRKEDVIMWMSVNNIGRKFLSKNYSEFNQNSKFDAIINFIGVGDPGKASLIGKQIFDITLKFDDIIIKYLKKHAHCKYLFLSSGAVFGEDFSKPVDENSLAKISINSLSSKNWYGISKLYVECRHRAMTYLPILDIRVFNYFSSSQDIESGYFITDIIRAIRDDTLLNTSSDRIVRDYLHPSDFYLLVKCLLSSSEENAVIDCYTKSPIDNLSLLEAMRRIYGLKYKMVKSFVPINATGEKLNYYSLNTIASNFGYLPNLTSLEGVMIEANKMLKIE